MAMLCKQTFIESMRLQHININCILGAAAFQWEKGMNEKIVDSVSIARPPWCRFALVFLAIFLGSGSAPVWAERYALLVGIGDYPQAALDLLGPKNDISALDKLLKDNWQFKPQNVRVLLDQQATKANVLAELRALKKRSQPGDELFFYYSGHGTSAGDQNVGLPLPDMTAGLLPYDAKLNLAKHEIISSLIVGRTDLRPIFRDLDASGRKMLVMIDACYSGNAVRGFGLPGQKMPSRFVRLDAKVDSLLQDTSQIQTRAIAASASEEAYPYQNVFFIAASGEFEEAADISGAYLKKFPTIDGKPHGAFTDAMLRVLSGDRGSVDTNGDQRVSHLETKQAIQDWMAGKFPQTPQHLPPSEEDVSGLASRSIFGLQSIPGTIVKAKPKQSTAAGSSPQPVTLASTLPNSGSNNPTVQSDNSQASPSVTPQVQQSQMQSAEPFQGLRVAVDSSAIQLARFVQQVPGVVLTEVYPDLRVVASASGIDLRNGANDLVISYPAGFEDQLIARVEQEAQVQQFLQRLKQDRSFNISVDVRGKQNNGPHLGGELVSFTVQSDSNAWLLLLDIDREGGINILFPSFQHEQRVQPRSLVLQTPEIEVVAPYGTDRIVAIGFEQNPVELMQWLGELTPRISPRTPRLAEFYNLVNKYSVGSAIQQLPFITVAGSQ